MNDILELEQENIRLQRENDELKAQVKELKQYIKDQSVVNGFLRRSYEQKSRMRRRFW